MAGDFSHLPVKCEPHGGASAIYDLPAAHKDDVSQSQLSLTPTNN